MNTIRKCLVATTVCIASSLSLFAQTEYYVGDKGSYELDDCVYVYKKDLGVDIYNSANMPLAAEWKRKDSSRIPRDVFFGHLKTIEMDAEDADLIDKLVNGSFTIEQCNSIAAEMLIEIRISPDTGAVTDVYFNIHRGDGYEFIPPTVFCKIERALKEQLHFTVTEEGKKMTYCMLVWEHKPKPVIISGGTFGGGK